MRAYRLTVNLKLGLVLFAIVIAVTSLFYTNRLADRLRTREQFIIELRARAQEEAAKAYGTEADAAAALTNFAGAIIAPDTNNFSRPFSFNIPSIIIDSVGVVSAWTWQNLPIPYPPPEPLSAQDSVWLVRRAQEMAASYPPVPIVQEFPGGRLVNYIVFDDSGLIRELRWFPYVQLLFVGLFILVGYLGFSYVRRSEQGSLWVGMAKEAAHQLGTPISSLMGWHQFLQDDALGPDDRHLALAEIENDIGRLQRVTARFSDIGSVPKLEPHPLAGPIEHTADYIRRRMPQAGQVALTTAVPADLYAPLNVELFEWVIENLLKNALDAMEGSEGRIEISARRENERAVIDVRDTGKGIDRRQWKNVFRPGYSTKKRGWGLGLSLAKRIVEDYHGGRLFIAESRIGGGTTFRIELPVSVER